MNNLIINYTNFTNKQMPELVKTSRFGMLSKQNLVVCHIHQNFPFALQSRVNPHFHSHTLTKSDSPYPAGDGLMVVKEQEDKKGCDIHNEVLPLTLQSEIKQHQIISLIKGNC